MLVNDRLTFSCTSIDDLACGILSLDLKDDCYK